MMVTDVIENMIGDNLPSYIQTYKDFTPGRDTVYYSGPYWDHRELGAAVNTLLTGKWITSGIEVAKFQSKFAKKFGVKWSHMVNSGSSANLIMFTTLKKHLKWNDRDAVIVSPVGFPTTIAPIVQNNLKPIFVDIEFDTLNFDLNLVEKAIKENPNVRAVVVSPVLGNPPDMELLKEICDEHGIIMIGDNCDSLGSLWNGKSITDFYYAWTASFYPAHHISTGEGGMVSSNDGDFISLARSISWWGRDCYCVGANNLLPNGTCGKRFNNWLPEYDGIVDHKYVFNSMGYNLKPLEMQGSMGLVQLEKYDEMEMKRRDAKLIVQAVLSRYIDDIKIVMPVNELSNPSWFGTPIICKDQAQKEKLVKFFETNKVQTRNYFAGNILLHEGYKHLGDHWEYPNANKALSHVFFLGASPCWTQDVFNYIQEVCQKWTN